MYNKSTMRTALLCASLILFANFKIYSQANIAIGKTATASSVGGTGLEANFVNDGNATSRWGSAYSDPQWVQIDLGATYNISRVVLKWEAAYAISYQIQISSNGSTWTSIYSTTAGNGATDDRPGLTGSGRYIRVNGTQRATIYGYSLFEFEVYGTAATAPNIAIGKTATASSTESTLTPNLAIDGNATTRWGSAYSDPQWIQIDLGATYAVNRVSLQWEAAYAISYQIQVSANASTWTSIYSTTTGDGATDDRTGLSGTGRYIRVYGTQRATAYGYSLFEFAVYGTLQSGGDTQAPTVPSNLVNSSITQTGATLTWNASTDNIGVTWYEVFRNGTSLGTVTGTSTNLTGLTCNTIYSLTVRARDAAGNFSAQSTAKSLTTSACSSSGPDLTGYTLQRNYNFGTAAGNTVTNTSTLSTNFGPYAIAGTSVINGEWQRYQPINSTNHVFTSNDLELTSVANLGGIYAGGISAGQITTNETFYPRNGRTYIFQIRAKIPNKRGSWPAFWMYAKAAPNTSSEIDIFEFFNNADQNQFDWTGYDHGAGVGADYHNIMTNQYVWHPGTDFSADYHTYTLIWKEGDIQKWVDNNWVKGTAFTWAGSDPQIILNLAMGGSINYNPDASSFPAKFAIDYLRVYYKDGTGKSAASPIDLKAAAGSIQAIPDGTISPNPAASAVSVAVSDEFLNGKMELIDPGGATILQRNISGRNELLQVSKLANGTYYLRIQNRNKVITKKLVISK